jgi:hypothetical protein
VLAGTLGDLADGRGAGLAEQNPHDKRPAAFDLIQRDAVDLGDREHEQGAQFQRGEGLARPQRQRDPGTDAGAAAAPPSAAPVPARGLKLP